MSTTHVEGMAQVQEPNCWDQSFPFKYLSWHPHKPHEACYKDCPLPHRTHEEAGEFWRQEFDNELMEARIRAEAKAAT